VIRGKVRNVKAITNILYVMARSSKLYKPWTNPDNKEFMNRCSEILVAEPALTAVMASRNLWNYYMIQHKDEKLFDKLSKVLVANSDLITGVDVSNALNCFAETKYVNLPVLETLIKVSIRNIESYNLFTLGNILLSLAKLDIRNNTVFAIAKTHILRMRDYLERPETTD
jgi:hypothetical protein